MHASAQRTSKGADTRRADAVVIRLTTSGLAYVLEDSSKCAHVFSFDKIRGYQGQTAEEMGLRIGAHVTLFVDGQMVDRVELARK